MAKYIYKALFVAFCLLCFVVIAHPASAAFGGVLVDPLACGGFQACVGKVISFLLTIALPLTAIMVLYGGFQMITAAGEPEKFSNGRKTLTYAAIGFVVVLVAQSVVPIIQSIFSGN